jgi:DNA-directed RNA polymerase specialized sigma24 family protein
VNEILARVENLDAQQARIVELRYFGGLSVAETAEAMAISPRTVKPHSGPCDPISQNRPTQRRP